MSSIRSDHTSKPIDPNFGVDKPVDPSHELPHPDHPDWKPPSKPGDKPDHELPSKPDKPDNELPSKREAKLSPVDQQRALLLGNIKRTLDAYKGMESNIPHSHDYWAWVNDYRSLTPQPAPQSL